MSCKHGNWYCEICEEIDQAYNDGVAAGRKAEREECAKLCDALRDCEDNPKAYRNGAGWCGERIRARGKVK